MSSSSLASNVSQSCAKKDEEGRFSYRLALQSRVRSNITAGVHCYLPTTRDEREEERETRRVRERRGAGFCFFFTFLGIFFLCVCVFWEKEVRKGGGMKEWGTGYWLGPGQAGAGSG